MDLHDHMQLAFRELSRDAFLKLSNDVNKRIFELVHSADTQVTGVLVIDKLIDLQIGQDNTQKVARFANYLRIVLPGNDPQITLAATRALGHLAMYTSSLTAEFVEFEVKRALEWLQSDRVEQRRFSAVLVLRELATHAPTLVYTFIPQILDLIWVPLKDPKVS